MPILALHGFTGCGADFKPLAEAYDTLWLCPDLPGHGSEPHLDCSPEKTVEFVESQRLSLTRLSQRDQNGASTQRVLLGYSMGARAALLHALKSPDAWDALVLISANAGIESASERNQRIHSDAALAARLERYGLRGFLDFWQKQPIIESQRCIRADWLKVMQANRIRHQTEGLAASLHQFGQGSFPNLWPKLSKLEVPTLCVAGKEDAKYTRLAQCLSKTLPNAQTVLISNAGHMPHLESPQSFTNALSKFLSDLASEVRSH